MPKSATERVSSADLPETRAPKLSRAVIGLGIVSLLTDVSSEAIFPLLPAFLATLGASNAFIGLLEGTADLVANVLKYVTGTLSDRRARLKPIVLAGYGVSTVARPLVAFALAPWHVLLVRVGDRIGKGVRTSPRDALIAAATDPANRARAYGFHRAMDHAGAALGTALGAGLLLGLGATRPEHASVDAMRTVFAWAAVPGVLAMVALALTPEPVRAMPVAKDGSERRPLPPPLKRALLPIGLFAFANATDAFILVKVTRLGGSPVLAPFIWLALHIIKAATATVGGRLADRYGKRNALAVGWTVYAITWSAVGFADSVPLLVGLSSVYGSSIGLVEGAEKALVADLAVGQATGKAFGAYNLIIGMSGLAASTTFGAVWDKLGSRVAFAGSGAVAVLAVVVLLASVPNRRARGSPNALVD